MRQISTFFSVLFHPTMMVSYAAYCYLFLLPSDFQFADNAIPFRILGMLFISTTLLPIGFLFVMMRFGRVSTIQMDERKERNWPLLQTAIIYFGAYYAIHSKMIPAFIQLFILGAIMGILISLVVNLKWKISLHMIGIGGLCGGLAAVMIIQQNAIPWVLSISFLIAGVLGTARLYLNAHTPAQILAGFLTGFSVQFLLMQLMLP